MFRSLAAGLAFVLVVAGGAWGQVPEPLAVTPMAPGVEYRQYRLTDPNDVFMVVVERRRSEYSWRIGWPGGDRGFTERAETSAIAKHYDDLAGQEVVAAANASFFAEIPKVIGAAVSGGQVEAMPGGKFDTMLINDGGMFAKVLEDLAAAPGVVTLPNGKTIKLAGFNEPMAPLKAEKKAAKDEEAGSSAESGEADSPADAEYGAGSGWYAYTPSWGEVKGARAVLRLRDVSYPQRFGKSISGWLNETGAAPVDAREMQVRPMKEDELLLVTRDLAAYKAIEAELKLKQWLDVQVPAPAPECRFADVMLCTIGWLLHDGQPVTENWKQYKFSSVRHPRTVFAWNDRHWFLVVVDGRSERSVGMTFGELALMLKQLCGATEAVNLDGGGSSALITQGEVRNVPSDGHERKVANALMLVRDKLSARTVLPWSDHFDEGRRDAGWDDLGRRNPSARFDVVGPDGEGYSMHVGGKAGGLAMASAGDYGDRNYSVAADVYCDVRRDAALHGFERYGIFARDTGTAAFGAEHLNGACYALMFDSDSGRLRAGRVVDGEFSGLAGKTVTVQEDGWRRLRIDCDGRTVRFFVGDELLYEGEDEASSHGRWGIGYREYFADNRFANGVHVDGVEVKAIEVGRGSEDEADESPEKADVDPDSVAAGSTVAEEPAEDAPASNASSDEESSVEDAAEPADGDENGDEDEAMSPVSQ